MSKIIGLVSISLGSVVLDRPDHTGRYFAKDLAGGWAYLVGDADGDNRSRGRGVCEGGLDLTLRCAFLAAASRVPDSTLIRIIVESPQAHRTMVRLAMKDPHVVAAIAGRPVSILTRPDAQSSFQVRTAAERAASDALRDREHAERNMADAEVAAFAVKHRDIVAPAKETVVTHAVRQEPDAKPDWRSRLRSDRPIDGATASASPAARGAGSGTASRTASIKAWLRDLESQVATVRCDLEEVHG
jgi:hypothetical protein